MLSESIEGGSRGDPRGDFVVGLKYELTDGVDSSTAVKFMKFEGVVGSVGSFCLYRLLGEYRLLYKLLTELVDEVTGGRS